MLYYYITFYAGMQVFLQIFSNQANFQRKPAFFLRKQKKQRRQLRKNETAAKKLFF